MNAPASYPADQRYSVSETIRIIEEALSASASVVSNLSLADELVHAKPPKSNSRLDKAEHIVRRVVMWMRARAEAMPLIEQADSIHYESIRAVDESVVKIGLHKDPLLFQPYLSATSQALAMIQDAPFNGLGLLRQVSIFLNTERTNVLRSSKDILDMANQLEALEPGEKYRAADYLEDGVNHNKQECNPWFSSGATSFATLESALTIEKIRLAEPEPIWPRNMIRDWEGQTKELADMMNSKGGAVTFKEAAEKFGWQKPYDEPANSLIKRFNEKLEGKTDRKIRRYKSAFVEKIEKS